MATFEHIVSDAVESVLITTYFYKHAELWARYPLD